VASPGPSPLSSREGVGGGVAALRGYALPRATLVLGGARSGKSRYAEELARGSGLAPVYLATATAGDAEMAERIAAHRARRGDPWTTVEEPIRLAGALACTVGPGRVVVVDCLTLWIANLLGAGRDVAAASAELAGLLASLPGPAILVANEVGLGIVPENALARAFRDAAGRLNQEMAARCDRVVLVAAGLPLVLKEERGT
jgi:adenosylcobinamide kinase/adenosylcobinamide-phosphate guanylyltransferase